MDANRLAEFNREEREIERERHRENQQKQEEKEFQQKLIRAFIQIGAKLFIFFVIALIPFTIVLGLVTFLADLIHPVEFPYNLYFQIPIGVFVLWLVWRFLRDKENIDE